MSKVDRSFYLNPDTLFIARQLIGKHLITNIDGQFTSGIICETEAYLGIEDRASHAFGNRRTKRTEIMYQSGGISYVYLCYGIHCLFNVVTNIENVPHAVLIRNIIPFKGKDIMMQRRKKQSMQKLITGPGTMTQALSINMESNGISLTEEKIWIEETDIYIDSKKIESTPRIGVDYAGKDAFLPYRFLLKEPLLTLF